MAAPSDDGECRGLEVIGGQPAQDRRRCQGPRGGRNRAAGRCPVKACPVRSSHAGQTQAIFVAPLKIVLDQLKNSLQAQPIQPANPAPDLVSSWKTKDGLTRVEALPRVRSQRQRDAAQVCHRGSGRRADRDRGTGIDSESGRTRGEGSSSEAGILLRLGGDQVSCSG